MEKCNRCGSEMSNLDRTKKYCPNCHNGINCECHPRNSTDEHKKRKAVKKVLDKNK